MRLGFTTRISVFCGAAGVCAAVALAATIVAATVLMTGPPNLIWALRILAALTCVLFASAGVAWIFSEHHYEERK